MQNFISISYFGEFFFILSIPFAAFSIVFLCTALFGNLLWRASAAFFLVDELIWFLYNPVRFLLKNQQLHKHNWQHLLFIIFIIKPVYQLIIYIITTPLRIINAIYFDIFIYILVMADKSLTQLFRPKHTLIRHSTGISYLFWCVLLCPLRLVWALFQNLATIIDSLCMLAISIAFPTFSMLHGTSSDGETWIPKKASMRAALHSGSNNVTYFGRNIRAAKQQTTSFLNDQQEIIYPIILARVNLGFLRNFGTQSLSTPTTLPTFAGEFWQEDIKSWGYYLVHNKSHKNTAPKSSKSWRMRAIGLMHVKHRNESNSRLTQLWGGQAHYCLGGKNILMAGIASMVILGQLVVFLNLLPTQAIL